MAYDLPHGSAVLLWSHGSAVLLVAWLRRATKASRAPPATHFAGDGSVTCRMSTHAPTSHALRFAPGRATQPHPATQPEVAFHLEPIWYAVILAGCQRVDCGRKPQRSHVGFRQAHFQRSRPASPTRA